MGKFPGIKMASGVILDGDEQGRRDGWGQQGHLPWAPLYLWAPKRSIYSNRTVKNSIKAVTTYILPWAPQALSAEDGERMIYLWMITAIAPTPLHRVLLRNSNRLKGGRVHRY